MMKTFGEKLKDFRVSKGYESQQEFACVLGYKNVGSIGAYEKMEKSPGPKVMIRFIKKLPHDVDEIKKIFKDDQIENNKKQYDIGPLSAERLIEISGQAKLAEEYKRQADEAKVKYERLNERVSQALLDCARLKTEHIESTAPPQGASHSTLLPDSGLRKGKPGKN